MRRVRTWIFQTAWQVAWLVLLPFALCALPFVMLIEKRRKTIPARFGFQRLERAQEDQTFTLWMHTLSVGELNSAIPVLHALRRELRSTRIVLSVTTYGAHRHAKNRKLEEIVDEVVFFPFDFLPSVQRVVGRIRPDVFVLVETDLWPTALYRVRKYATRMMLINTRVSKRSRERYRRKGWLLADMLTHFDSIIPQSPEEAEAFIRFGARPEQITFSGNLKWDASLPTNPPAPETVRSSLPFEPPFRVMLAGSTHPGEEAILLASFAELRRQHPDLRLICVPRNISRGPEIRRIAQEHGLSASCISEREKAPSPAPGLDVWIVDAIGHLQRLYAGADVAFVGGSLVPYGGQNPIEPAAVGVPVIFGPNTFNFPDIAPQLVQAGAAEVVHGKDDIVHVVDRLLSDQEEWTRRSEAGRRCVDANTGALQKTIDHICGEMETVQRLRNR